MNKYFISKDNVVRFNSSFKQSDKKMYISDLYFLKHSENIDVSPDKTKWRSVIFNSLNNMFEWKERILVTETKIPNHIFQFETDEEALLFEEMMDE